MAAPVLPAYFTEMERYTMADGSPRRDLRASPERIEEFRRAATYFTEMEPDEEPVGQVLLTAWGWFALINGQAHYLEHPICVLSPADSGPTDEFVDRG